MSAPVIRVRGATQNNLKNVDVDLRVGELTVVTGVSGSGKSSLAFDTVYAEGQRRYVETFSPYARQFLDRMDKPQAGRIEGIPPSIAIDQTNPVRTSRSTVGTMTELNDHLKLLFARVATAYCPGCAQPVRRDDPGSIADALLGDPETPARIEVRFAVTVPDDYPEAEVRRVLERQGYTRIHGKAPRLDVVQGRQRAESSRRAQLVETLEAALKRGRGHVEVHDADGDGAWSRRFSTHAHCAECDRTFRTPIPSLFSFNSPAGACPDCRGFGRQMGIDLNLVVPDTRLSLADGAVKPFQSKSYSGCQRDLMRHARERGIDVKAPWRELDESDRDWVMHGEGSLRSKRWYGVKRFFDWLETKAYRMHIRVLLSRYRSYDVCTTCNGARLKPEALDWRLGDETLADDVLDVTERLAPHHTDIEVVGVGLLPGLHVHDLMVLPLGELRRFFDGLELPAPLDEATELLMGEIRGRIGYLCDVGLAYLTLDRQSRTLSGGEVQRINLTTALGTSLVNTLFVLDEPSIGLHSRDMARVTGVLARLRDAGNTLLVVEHDPAVMLAADRIIDMGPGPGERGGTIVFEGTPKQLLAKRGSLTGDYLSGRRDIGGDEPRTARPVSHDDPDVAWVGVRGATEHNLRSVDADFPLERLTCVTGVSGSGKSTLVEDVFYQALRAAHGQPDETPGAHERLLGAELVDEVVMVDQSPIGKTTRSNPASFVGALDPIRKLFAREELAVERGYTAGTFSFNAGNGRCPSCSGNGFEHVEMQFLSDVYLRCPECNGRRYRDEVLEVRLLPAGASGEHAASIADVLEMTVTEALEFFAGAKDVHATLAPLAAVGLEYLRLGQPVPTLSGGEAQRLKLAGHLAKHAGRKRRAAARRGTLFLFDEPTTGLHFHDIARLLGAFDALVDAGHTLIVIEHNLDVIRHADWLVDLGPEGGTGGGLVVAAGAPADVKAAGEGHTARALRGDYDAPPPGGRRKPVRSPNRIDIHNAREHNLKGVDVEVPRDTLTVITGVSGSGKSTVAFDILFGEGQRRYLESLNAYARQFVQPASRPEVDAVLGIPPTVAIEQRTSRGGRKSTVGTVTEIHHFLRLLYVRLGTQYCPECDVPIRSQDAASIVAELVKRHRGETIELLSPLVVARKGYYTDLARWAGDRGYAHLRVDGELLPTADWPRLDRFIEHDIDLPVASVRVSAKNEVILREQLDVALGLGKGLVRAGKAGGEERLYSTERACPSCSRSFPEPDPRMFSWNSRHGWCPTCFGTGLAISDFDAEQTGEEATWEELDEATTRACPSCDGARLNPSARAVRLDDQGIHERSASTVAEMAKTLPALKLDERGRTIARDILAELGSRLRFLEQVGLGYLTLDRSAPTLSGGEAQRIRLAAQLGSNLRGVCYILDEPTIGLHPVDNVMLLDTLEELRAKGNTVLVVEHDEDTIRRAGHVIDLGPGAGRTGGEVVATGTVAEVQRAERSVTGRFLANPLAHPVDPDRVREPSPGNLEVVRACSNNLRNVSVSIPLGRLTCVTGVSGSGKSTLVRDVLLTNLAEQVGKRRSKRSGWHGCERIDGLEHVDRVLEVDQTPIGKTPRSCPATYLGIFDAIRRLFADTQEARLRGYGAARFSFNVAGGRCETCDGQGMQRIEMNFLPDVRVPCERCGGSRYNEDTLSVTWRGRSIAEVLDASVEDSVEFFAAHTKLHHALSLLRDVGLGYLRLGQPSPTLSGGEAQRLKLVTELARAQPAGAAGRRRKATHEHAVFVLDEPTTGLHMADVARLIHVLHRLVDAGHTVVVVEHNLDVIAEADHLVDMGPSGGSGGGKVVASGPPARLAKRKRHTATTGALAEFLASRSGG